MGKSLGNVLDHELLLERCGADAVRWFLLRDIPFGDDGDFQQQRFGDLVNNDLANTIGNLLNRTSSMARKWFEENVPPAAAADHPLATCAASAQEKVIAALDAFAFRQAAEAILELAIAANGHLNEQAPWTLIKEEHNRPRVAADLYAVLETCRLVAVLLLPLVPELAQRMLKQLNCPLPTLWHEQLVWGLLPSGSPLPQPEPVMQRLELDEPL